MSRRYFRYGLRRQLFWLFGVAIALSHLSALLVMRLFSDDNAHWNTELGRVRGFFTARLVHHWDAPRERDHFLTDLSDSLLLKISLQNPRGEELGRYGESLSCASRTITIPIARAEEPLGSASLCAAPRGYDERNTWAGALALLVAGMVMWGLSGKVARRFARPLSELARVAEEIGRGKLSSRVRLTRGRFGEVGALADTINRMAARIERQMADQRELLAAVSHELRTPLARVRLLTEMARDQAAPPPLMDSIDEEMIELDALVGELLARSRLDFASLAPQPVPAAAAAARALERAGLSGSLLRDESRGAEVLADPTLLARALANLLENAARHGGGLASLRVVDRGAHITLEAEDDGPGLAPGDESRIFDPFYQSAPRRGERAGLGLGLALVRRIAEAHGGSAFAHNRTTRGARVGLSLPKPPAPAGDDTVP